MIREYLVPIAVLMAMLSLNAGAVGQVRVDPNQKRAVAIASREDEVLTKKVTLNVGGKRLHDITDELSSTSGIRVRSGGPTSDWSIRDLPVDVFANNVPLIKLSAWIGEAAHLAVVVNKTNDSGSVPSISLRRDKKCDRELADDETRALADADWCWDAYVKLGCQSEQPSLDVTAAPAVKQSLQRILAAKILASLPSNAKEKVFRGETVLLDARSPQASLLKDLVLVTRTAGISAHTITFSGGSMKNSRPDESDPDHAMLSIQLLDLGGEQGVCPAFVISPQVCGSMVSSFDYALKPDNADIKALNLIPRPRKLPADDDPEYDCGGSIRHFITSDKDWNAPILRTKLHLDLPEGSRTYADVLSAMSKASGFSVVCEDFSTCRTGPSDNLKALPLDTTLGEALKALRNCWFSVDEKTRLIIGWARDWRGHQRDLAPENMLTELKAKITGKGAELDDVTPLANLTTGQMNEWIRSNPSFADMKFQFFFPDKMLWRVYDSLSPEDKAMAKTANGVSLASLNIGDLSEDFRRLRRYRDLTMVSSATQNDLEKKTAIAEAQMRARILADPAQLQQATLRIVSKSVTPQRAQLFAGRTVLDSSDGTPLGNMEWMELNFFGQTGVFTIRVDGGPGVFPIRAHRFAAQ